MYLTDELLEKVAKARNVTPLAHSFGVKLSDAIGMKDSVKLSACAETLAHNGYAGRNKDEQDELMNIAQMVEAKFAADADVQTDHSYSLFRLAGEKLAKELGVASPEASSSHYASMQDSADKTAQYLGDPSVIMHMLAIHDAAQLVK